MIARDSERIGGSERGKIGLPIGEFVERPRERGFEEPQIAYSIAAASALARASIGARCADRMPR